MTAQGSAEARFWRGIATRRPMIAQSIAFELPRVQVEHALALVLLVRDVERDRYDAFAARRTFEPRRTPTMHRPTPRTSTNTTHHKTTTIDAAAIVAASARPLLALAVLVVAAFHPDALAALPWP